MAIAQSFLAGFTIGFRFFTQMLPKKAALKYAELHSQEWSVQHPKEAMGEKTTKAEQQELATRSKSSWVQAIKYHPLTATIGNLWFKASGKWYVYPNVSVTVWEHLKTYPFTPTPKTSQKGLGTGSGIGSYFWKSGYLSGKIAKDSAVSKQMPGYARLSDAFKYKNINTRDNYKIAQYFNRHAVAGVPIPK